MSKTAMMSNHNRRFMGVGPPNKRKAWDHLNGPKPPLKKPIRPNYLKLGPISEAQEPEPARNNKLLAGYLAQEFITKGTLFGEPWDPARPESVPVSADSRREVAETNRAKPSKEKYERYVEVADLLKTDRVQLSALMMDCNHSASTLPPPQLQHGLLESITSTLLKASAETIPSSLSPYIPHLTPHLVLSLLSSKALSARPAALLSFFKWSQSHLHTETERLIPCLLSVLSTLFSHNKFIDAKSLLLSFISTDRHLVLHRSLLHPPTRPSKALLDTAVGAYIQSGRPHLALQIFKRMKRLRIQPNVLTCNTLLNSMVKYPSPHPSTICTGVFNDAIQLGVLPNTNMFNIIIRGYCVENKFRDAMELLQRMAEYHCLPDNVSYNTILDSLCKKGRFNDARELLLDMKSRNLLPNKNTYNILVCGYCKVGWLKEAAKVIELMTQSKLLPDRWTYNMLINALCNEGKVNDAFKLRDEMENLKLLPDVITYNTLINGCFKRENSSKAFQMLEEMKEKGVELNVVTHNILVKWYCKQGKMDEASQVIRQMEEGGLAPDCITYNTLISGFCKAGNLGEAFEMMSVMVGKGLKMDNFTLNTVLQALCGEAKLDEAYELLTSAIKRGYVVDEVSYGTLIMGHFRNENIDKAMILWDEMKAKDIIPTIITYNSLIGGLCKSGKMEQAMAKLNELLENGLVPDETTYNSIIHGYCWEGNVEKAFQFHNKMVENSFKPDIYTCNILLRGLCRDGMLEKALKLFNTWISKGKEMDVVTYNTLITALCKEGRLEDALDLVADMEVKKLGPDNYTCNAIVGALTEVGRVKEVEELIAKMSTATKKSPFPCLEPDKKKEVGPNETPENPDLSILAYSEQINELCAAGKYKDAMAIYVELTHKGVALSKSTHLALINGLVKRKKPLFKGAHKDA